MKNYLHKTLVVSYELVMNVIMALPRYTIFNKLKKETNSRENTPFQSRAKVLELCNNSQYKKYLDEVVSDGDINEHLKFFANCDDPKTM